LASGFKRWGSYLLWAVSALCSGQNAIFFWESLVARLKAELVSRWRFPDRKAAKTANFEYLESFYPRRRIHSSLGYMREASAAA
jgi:transposase InsO family protein